jgi:4-hydroxy-tetrahydrodipicolinate synthase
MEFELHGIVPPLLTPLDENERVSEPDLRRLVNYVIEGGVHAVFALGSTGEPFALTGEEQKRCVCIAVEEAAGRVPVLAGVSDCSTRKALRNAEAAAEAGASAVVSTLPYYATLGPEEQKAYFTELADRSPLPVIIYNHPLTKVNLSRAVLCELLAHDRIIGLKDSYTDVIEFERLLIALGADRRARILTGSEFLVAPTMLMGGDGAVVAVANVAPRLFVDCYEACVAGDWERAAEIQRRLVDFSLGLFVMTPAGVPPSIFWGGLKQAMVALGVFSDARLHRPLLPVGEELRKQVDGTLRKYEVL